MATTTTKDLVCTFVLDDGTNSSITIPDYNPEVADAAIKTQLNAAVAANVLGSGGHAFTGLSAVKKVDTTTTEVTIE